MKTLYHYTCDHGHQQIDGLLFPAARLTSTPLWPGPGQLVWLTDLAHPVRDALGLTSHILACDRTTHRYRVTDATLVLPWVKVRRGYSWAAELESAHGARPMHWFVASTPVSVVYDPVLVGAL